MPFAQSILNQIEPICAILNQIEPICVVRVKVLRLL